MQPNLVIVESPAKAKTIEKFLGKDYKVMSSFGHIRDLSKKDFGVDIAHNFQPIYEITPDKTKLVHELKANAQKAGMVWLASDEDREGEAIAWHLYDVLGLEKNQTKRIVFHEITKEAILSAIKHPRDIDANLVNAQQARRVLDRIVGFELSPVLWRKIKPSLSAGRVQSVAVRLIVEKEREIERFKAEASYKVVVSFLLNHTDGGQSTIKADLTHRLATKEEALAFLESCRNATFKIEDIVTKPSKKTPAPPFTTSTLQQEASRKLGFSVSQTMMIAQRLYESGKITYMRTDSVNLSSLAINTSKAEIESIAGTNYIKIRHYQTKTKGAQEAHEAIRPTYMNVPKIDGTAQEKRLYELIWKRTIASQMADAEFEKTSVVISMSGTKDKLEATGEVLTFDGFLKVYLESNDDEPEAEENSKMLPSISLNDTLKLESASATERFTQRPPRYTEASLVRKLEELGIGRPSTYAPTISTIQQRGYVVKEDREGQARIYSCIKLEKNQLDEQTLTETIGTEKAKLFPTDIGIVVNDFLLDSFPDILDFNFTASVEKQFDQIAEGDVEWENVISEFYKTFHPSVEQASAWSKQKVGERILGNDPKTGRVVSARIGRFGPVVQIGVADDEEKPLFASLLKSQRLETITLDEALDLFKLPRTAGEYEDKTVTIGIGRFGPYIRHDSKFISIPKTFDPMEISLESCIELIENKRQVEKNKIIKTFDAEGIQILNGRYGPYFTKDGNNYRIPKAVAPDTLTPEACLKLVQEQGEKPSKKASRKGAGTSKTALTKAAAAKKAATSKKASTTKKATAAKKAPAKKAAAVKTAKPTSSSKKKA
ncbi:MAG: type I DNA topoisomerase [Bacteroidota bacterium]|nr:type I DNA topoisomerase [Bacteroidota bacterium]